MTWSTILQQIVWPIIGALMPVLATGKIPDTWQAWLATLAAAAVASGALNVTAPRNQGATIIPGPKG